MDWSSERLKLSNWPVDLESTVYHASSLRAAAWCDVWMSAGVMLLTSDRLASSARSIHAGPKGSRLWAWAKRRTRADIQLLNLY